MWLAMLRTMSDALLGFDGGGFERWFFGGGGVWRWVSELDGNGIGGCGLVLDFGHV